MAFSLKEVDGDSQPSLLVVECFWRAPFEAHPYPELGWGATFHTRHHLRGALCRAPAQRLSWAFRWHHLQGPAWQLALGVNGVGPLKGSKWACASRPQKAEPGEVTQCDQTHPLLGEH